MARGGVATARVADISRVRPADVTNRGLQTLPGQTRVDIAQVHDTSSKMRLPYPDTGEKVVMVLKTQAGEFGPLRQKSTKSPSPEKGRANTAPEARTHVSINDDPVSGMYGPNRTDYTRDVPYVRQGREFPSDVSAPTSSVSSSEVSKIITTSDSAPQVVRGRLVEPTSVATPQSSDASTGKALEVYNRAASTPDGGSDARSGGSGGNPGDGKGPGRGSGGSGGNGGDKPPTPPGGASSDIPDPEPDRPARRNASSSDLARNIPNTGQAQPTESVSGNARAEGSARKTTPDTYPGGLSRPQFELLQQLHPGTQAELAKNPPRLKHMARVIERLPEQQRTLLTELQPRAQRDILQDPKHMKQTLTQLSQLDGQTRAVLFELPGKAQQKLLHEPHLLRQRLNDLAQIRPELRANVYRDFSPYTVNALAENPRMFAVVAHSGASPEANSALKDLSPRAQVAVLRDVAGAGPRVDAIVQLPTEARQALRDLPPTTQVAVLYNPTHLENNLNTFAQASSEARRVFQALPQDVQMNLFNEPAQLATRLEQLPPFAPRLAEVPSHNPEIIAREMRETLRRVLEHSPSSPGIEATGPDVKSWVNGFSPDAQKFLRSLDAETLNRLHTLSSTSGADTTTQNTVFQALGTGGLEELIRRSTAANPDIRDNISTIWRDIKDLIEPVLHGRSGNNDSEGWGRVLRNIEQLRPDATPSPGPFPDRTSNPTNRDLDPTSSTGKALEDMKSADRTELEERKQTAKEHKEKMNALLLFSVAITLMAGFRLPESAG